MNTNILSLISISILLSCCHSSKQNIDGGPCSYTINHLQAVVITVDSINQDEVNLRFICPEYTMEKERDTFSYYRLYHRYLSSTLIREKKIYPGQRIPFHVETIREGSCDPRVTRLMIDSV